MVGFLRVAFASPYSKNLLLPAACQVVVLGLCLWLIPRVGIESAMVGAPLIGVGWLTVLNVRTRVSRGAKAAYCAVSLVTSTSLVTWRAVSVGGATFDYAVAWAGGFFAFGLVAAFLMREQGLVVRSYKGADRGSEPSAVEE